MLNSHGRRPAARSSCRRTRPTPATYAIDFINTEQVAPIANPDPARVRRAGRLHPPGRAERAGPGPAGHQPDRRLPAGRRLPDVEQVPGVRQGGQGRRRRPLVHPVPRAADQEQHRRRLPGRRHGERLDVRELRLLRQLHHRGSTGRARCSTSPTSSNITIDNIWIEHMVCLYWGANTDNMTIKNSRIRNMFADGINMTNGSTNNLVTNNDARATGDDSFALFSAIDAGGADMNGQRLREPDLHADLAGRRHRRLRRLRQHVPQHLHRGHAGLLRHHDQLAGLRLPDERLRRQPADRVREHLDRPGRRPLLGRRRSSRRSGCSPRRRCSRASGSATSTSSTRPTAASCSRPTTSAASRRTRSPTPSSPTSRSPGRRRAVTPTTPSPASASGPTRCRRPGQGPAVGSVTFNNLRLSNNSATSRTPPELHHHPQLGPVT